MTYPKHLFRTPGPYGIGKRTYDVAGATNEAEEAALVAKGWSITKDFGKPHPLDHDGDGEKGGSIAPPADDDLPALRAEYQQKMGKRAFPGWGAAEIRKRMAG